MSLHGINLEDLKLSPAYTKYGHGRFNGSTAKRFLSKQDMTLEEYESKTWVHDMARAEVVAAALLDWSTAHGATTYCHWFQPLGATFRHGMAGQLQLSMVKFSKDGTAKMHFTASDLLQGETDGSSYLNGGLRNTHEAGGYLLLNPDSPPFVLDDCMHIPAIFVSYKGASLDEKISLKRADQALDKEGCRLLKLMGYEVAGLQAMIGLEQEFFIIPRGHYYRRPDLTMCGRTVMGQPPPRGQEGCDHYMGPLNNAMPAVSFMREVQEECFKLGIPLVTKHREVAPNQYELAPMFGSASVQTDENLLVMQLMTEIAPNHGLACLLQEKPFDSVNGSGKHNNWSLGTSSGVNIFNPKQITEVSGNPMIFPVVMACVISAIDMYADLMRMAIASPGNDFRLGAMEAPPSIISTNLGKSLVEYLEIFMKSPAEAGMYKAHTEDLDLGLADVPKLAVPSEDRNRTSPFPYGGNRFEFRAVGSSQNVSLVNTVLGSITASQFKVVSDRVDKGEKPEAVAQELLKKHFRVVFNGNGYSEEWQVDAAKRGLPNIPSGIDAIRCFSNPKNVAMFKSLGVFTEDECRARECVLLQMYILTVDVECCVMRDMIRQHVLPSVVRGKEFLESADDLEKRLRSGLNELNLALKALRAKHEAGADSPGEVADLARVLRLETMAKVRVICDEAERKMPADLWTLATYSEMFFLHSNEPESYFPRRVLPNNAAAAAPSLSNPVSRSASSNFRTGSFGDLYRNYPASSNDPDHQHLA